MQALCASKVPTKLSNKISRTPVTIARKGGASTPSFILGSPFLAIVTGVRVVSCIGFYRGDFFFATICPLRGCIWLF